MRFFSRPAAVPVFLALAVVALAAGNALWSDYRLQSRGAAFGPNLPTLRHVDVPHHGINADLANEPDGELDQHVAVLKQGGYGLVRQPFPWREIEPARGVFQWSRYDRLVAAYRRAGLQILAVLDRPPDWSRRDNNWPNRPPDDFADFGRFASTFAARYRGAIDYLQVWDEPNVFPNWGNRPVDPAAYVALLAAAYSPIKSANPDAVVLMAGLAPNNEQGGRNMSDLRYLQAMYEADAAPYFDVAADKPYGLWFSPLDRTLAPDRTNFSRLVQWREIMDAAGDGATPIWAVEFGWNALPAGWAGRPSTWGKVSDQEQAAFTVAALARARGEWPWLPVMILQGYLPHVAPDDPRLGFSILDHVGQPRAIFGAVQGYLSEHRGAPIGRHGAQGPHIDLSGTARREGFSVLAQAGDTVRLSFYGTRLDLLVQMRPDGLPAMASVDGQPANRLVKIARAAWLDTARRLSRYEQVTVADGLPEGEHKLVLVVAGRDELSPRRTTSAGAFKLMGFAAIREQDLSSVPWPIAGYLLVALGALAAAGRGIARWPVWAPAWRRVAVLVRVGYAVVGRTARHLTRAWLAIPSERRDFAAFALLGVGIGLLYAAPDTAPAALLAVLVSVAARPDAAIFGLFATAPLTMRPVQIAGAQFSPPELVAVTAAVALVGRLLGDRAAGETMRRVGSRLAGPAALLLFAAVVATIFAGQQREAWRELRTVIVEPLVIYALVLRRPRSEFELARFLDVLVLVGVAVALVGIYQYWFTSDAVLAEQVRRVRVFYGSPNNVGLFLGRVIPIALCLGLGDPRRRWHVAALAPLALALGLTFSVGSWLGVAAALLFVAALSGRRLVVAVSGTLAAAGGAVFALGNVTRLTSHLSLDAGTNLTRILLWRGALDMLRDHPFWGVGPDNFYHLYRTIYRLPEAWREPDLSHPHNLVLDFWLRTGLAGLVAGLWLLASFFSLGLRLYQAAAKPLTRAIVLGLLASMVDAVVHGLVDNSFFLVDLALVFWFSFAALEVVRQQRYNTVDLP